MLSNKLTFSLASLVLILAFALVAMPVMAATDGPSVSISKYTASDYTPSRNDIRVKVTISGGGGVSVIGDSAAATADSSLSATDFTVQRAEMIGAASGEAVTDLTLSYIDDEDKLVAVADGNTTPSKMFVLSIDLTAADIGHESSVLVVSLEADVANGVGLGLSGHGKGNMASNTLALSGNDVPSHLDWTITASLVPDSLKGVKDGKLLTEDPGADPAVEAATFMVDFTYTGGTPGTTVNLPSAQIQVLDAEGEDVKSSFTLTPAGTDYMLTGGKATVTFTVGDADVDPVTIGVNPNYAAANAITVPSSMTITTPDMNRNPPSVAISVVPGTLDTVAKTFDVRYEFTAASENPAAIMFSEANVKVTKDAEGMIPAGVTADVEGLLDGTTWIVTIGFEHDALPLYVSTTATTSPDPTPLSVMAKVPGMPTGLMATADQTADTITITWAAPADDGGSPITGYELVKTYGANMRKVLPHAGTTTTFTTEALGPDTYSFTAAAMNSAGTGSATAAVMATIDAPPDTTAPNVSIADVVGTQSAAFQIVITASDDKASLTAANVSVSVAPMTSATATAASAGQGANAGKFVATITPTAATTATLPEEDITITVSVSDGVQAGTATKVVKLAERMKPVTPDTTAPNVSIADVVGTQSAAFQIVITASDDKASLTAANVSVSVAPMTSATATAASAGQGANAGKFVATITPTAATTATLPEEDITITVSVSDGVQAGTATKVVKLAERMKPDTGGPGTIPTPGTTDGTATGSATEVSVMLGTTQVAKGHFIVLANNATAAGIRLPSDANYSVFTVTNGLPDLEDFFVDGGAIDVVGPTGSGAIVISEIMWGADENYPTGSTARMAGQWIELFVAAGGTSKGTATGAVKGDTPNTAAIAGPWRLVFSRSVASDPAPVTGSVDRMSNWGLGKWSVIGGGHGKNGRTRMPATESRAAVAAEPFVSMYRNINHTDLVNTDKTRTDQLNAIPDGTHQGSWKEDAVNRGVYQTAEMGRRYATPGGQHISGIIKDTDTTSLARDGVVFNEIANRSKDEQDWLELYNQKKGAVNIKGWQLSVITDNATETVLFEFKSDEDINIPGEGYLLVVNKDPADTSLAVGQNIADPNTSPQGVDTLFYVDAELKIPKTKALLMLRSGTDKNKTHEKIVDVAAINGGFFSKSDKDFNTEVWPLKSTAAGATDDITENDGVTWVRDQSKALFHGDAWKNGDAPSKVTWVGVDRNADEFHSGTPGYANDAVQGEFFDADAKAKYKGMVTVSEVMVDQTQRSLPQWIELFNNSRTQAVNIKGWELKVMNVNSTDLDARTNWTVKIDGDLIIAPSQTALIVSGSGRHSSDIPDSAIYNLYAKHRRAIEMNSQRDSVLSTEGFYISLFDARDAEADVVGNIDSNPRTMDAPEWALPMYADGRSSLIRRYVDGTADNGMTAEGWALAGMTNVVPRTYYGDSDDIGSPGAREGSPLPVSLSSFRPARDTATGAVVIRWITESELDNAGFNILRSETKTGEFKVVNVKGIIAGHGTTSEQHVYTFTDTTAKPNVVYYYQIEDVSLDGKRTTLRTTHLRGNVTAAGKATTRWGELKDSRY